MLRTKNATLIAFAILFQTSRFFAIAPFDMLTILNLGSWMEYLFFIADRVNPLLNIVIIVMAPHTVATWKALQSLLKAFTIELQTFRFLAIASNPNHSWFFTWGTRNRFRWVSNYRTEFRLPRKRCFISPLLILWSLIKLAPLMPRIIILSSKVNL